MPEEEEDLAEVKERLLEGVEAQIPVKKAAVPNLQEQQKKTITPEEDDHTSGEEEMVGAEDLSSVIGAISGGTSLMSVLKGN